MASLAAAPPSAHSSASLENDKSALGAGNGDPEKAGSGYDQEVRSPFVRSLFCGVFFYVVSSACVDVWLTVWDGTVVRSRVRA